MIYLDSSVLLELYLGGSRAEEVRAVPLLLREWTGHAVRLETFDERLEALAKRLDLR